MLFTEPNADPKPLQRIVFVADISDDGREALKKAIALAAAERSERLYVIRIVTTFDEIRAAAEQPNGGGDADEETKLEDFVLSVGHTDVPIEVRCIRGNTGFAAADFVKSVSADLLIVPVPRSQGPDAPLPANVAWITDVIPCNVWVIR
jgi:nucleotide-binding universal stress UspA family protein